MLQVGIGVGAVVVVLLWMMSRGPSLLKLVAEAVEKKDVSALLEAAKTQAPKQRSFFYQRSIQLLWNGYHRTLAAQVIKVFAVDCPDEKITQYWMRQVLELEPEVAEEVLGDEFLEEHYVPEVAACCGVASS